MVRVNKPAAVRSAEIMSAAGQLFRQFGVDAVTIDQIAAAAGIAKGTFYLYFRSKSALLAAMADAMMMRMAEKAQQIVNEAPGSATDVFIKVFAALKSVERDEQDLSGTLDLPEHIELHERINIAFVKQLGAVLAPLVERGCVAGDFNVDDPLAALQFILAGQAFLLGNNRFGWSEAEQQSRFLAVLSGAERVLGARPGSFAAPLQRVLSD